MKIINKSLILIFSIFLGLDCAEQSNKSDFDKSSKDLKEKAETYANHIFNSINPAIIQNIILGYLDSWELETEVDLDYYFDSAFEEKYPPQFTTKNKIIYYDRKLSRSVIYDISTKIKYPIVYPKESSLKNEQYCNQYYHSRKNLLSNGNLPILWRKKNSLQEELIIYDQNLNILSRTILSNKGNTPILFGKGFVLYTRYRGLYNKFDKYDIYNEKGNLKITINKTKLNLSDADMFDMFDIIQINNILVILVNPEKKNANSIIFFINDNGQILKKIDLKKRINSLKLFSDNQFIGYSKLSGIIKNVYIFDTQGNHKNLDFIDKEDIKEIFLLKNELITFDYKKIKTWKLDGECKLTIQINNSDDPNKKIVKIIQLNDGRLASCTRWGAIKIWNIKTGQCETELGINELDNRNQAINFEQLEDGRLAIFLKNGKIQIWKNECLNLNKPSDIILQEIEEKNAEEQSKQAAQQKRVNFEKRLKKLEELDKEKNLKIQQICRDAICAISSYKQTRKK